MPVAAPALNIEPTATDQPAMSYWLAGMTSVLATTLVLILLAPWNMFPADEGQYAQCADRILQGQLPHRDFQDMYSGGLSYLNAALFLCFGRSLVVLRYGMIAFSIPAICACFDIAYRLTSHAVLAGVTTFCCFVASIGMTHAASPSVYLSNLSLLMSWALLRYTTCQRWQYLCLSGALAGIAIMIKVTGVYLLAAALIALIFIPDASKPTIKSGERSSRSWINWAAATACATAVLLLLRPRLSPDAAGYFLLPVLVLLIGLIAKGSTHALPELALRAALLVVPATVVVLALMVPWLSAGAMDALYRGLFVLPRLRINDAYYPPPTLIQQVPGLLVALVVLPLGQRWAVVARWVGLGAVALVLLHEVNARDVTRFHGQSLLAALGVWRSALPALALVGVWFVSGTNAGTLSIGRRAEVMTLLSFAVFFNLNQYPFTQPVYFFYGLPGIFLAALGVASLIRDRRSSTTAAEVVGARPIPWPAALAMVAFTGFCLLRLGREGVFGQFAPDIQALGHGRLSGLWLPTSVVQRYTIVKQKLDERLSSNQTILAGPDSPELYFLCQRPNLTPLICDLFARRSSYEAQMVSVAHRREVAAIVVNTKPEFSTPWSDDLINQMADDATDAVIAGRFVVIFKPTARPQRF